MLGEAKPSQVYSILKPHFRVSSPPQSRSQAVVCVSTPRKYPPSGYFLVDNGFKILPSQRSGCSASETLALSPIAATQASNPSCSSVLEIQKEIKVESNFSISAKKGPNHYSYLLRSEGGLAVVTRLSKI